MKLANRLLLMICLICTISCSRMVIGKATDVPELTPLKIGSGVIMKTDDDVTWREYGFSESPLTFLFSDSTTSVISYADNYKKPLTDIYINPEIVLKKKSVKGNYIWNIAKFKDDQVNSILTGAYSIAFGERRYIYCTFDKRHLTRLPFEENVSYLVDITNPSEIKAIAFPDVMVVDDIPANFFPENGHLCIRFDYYSRVESRASKTSNAVLTQNENYDWIIR